MRQISVRGPIRLDQFLKWSNAAGSGGQGKMLVQSGMVSVNGNIVYNRGRNIIPGDVVDVEGIGTYKVVQPEEL